MKKKRNSKIPITKANKIRNICRMKDNLEFLIYSVWTLSSDRMQYATQYKQIDEKKQNISQMRSISNENNNTNSNSNNSNSNFDEDENDIDIDSKQMNDAAIL